MKNKLIKTIPMFLLYLFLFFISIIFVFQCTPVSIGFMSFCGTVENKNYLEDVFFTMFLLNFISLFLLWLKKKIGIFIILCTTIIAIPLDFLINISFFPILLTSIGTLGMLNIVYVAFFKMTKI